MLGLYSERGFSVIVCRGFNKRRFFAFLHDVGWVGPSIILAYMVRYNLEWQPQEMFSDLAPLLAIGLVIHPLSYWFFGLYRGVWRFASIPDLVRIIKAVVIGGVFTVFLAIAHNRLVGVPRTTLLLYPMFLMIGISVPRLFYRWFKDHRFSFDATDIPRALIVGAGTTGELLVRDLLRNGGLRPVAILDDDRRKLGSELHGVRVCDKIAQLPAVVLQEDIDLVVLAMPGASHAARQKVVELCAQASVPCRTIPSVEELSDAADLGARLREVEIEDLLGRDPVALDEAKLEELLLGKNVLVTGAGGSIGSELCRQVSRFSPGCLIALDSCEFNLYRIDQELGKISDGSRWVPVLGNVRDNQKLDYLFKQYRPDVVLHAAAYKHVPLLETNEAEGVETNIFGTRNVLQHSLDYGVERFVLVSTDKAVNPCNVMGATKRVAELICSDAQSDGLKTKIIVTRFGNVLGSAGSVVPLFRSQIEKGGPVTVTDPEMTRYFMTIPEASGLVLQAAAQGEGGQTYVLQMGEPVRIIDLAKQMIRLAGLEPIEDIDIEYTGLRPGEKMHETLFYPEEQQVGTSHGKILRAVGCGVESHLLEQVLANMMEALVGGVPVQVAPELRGNLSTLVPSLPSSEGEESIEKYDLGGSKATKIVELHPSG